MLTEVTLLVGLGWLAPTPPEGDPPIDTLTLKEVIVNARVDRYSSGLSLKIISSQELKRSQQLTLSDLFEQHTNIGVNNYGPGGISSASIRGLGGGHTAVLWNGISLQSPMNGTVNLSLIPVSVIDRVAVQHGGNSTLFGSGAIGGVIHLDNYLELDKGHSTELYQTLGSFGSHFSRLSYKYSGKKLGTATKIYYAEAENNFRFHNIAKIGKPYERQKNASTMSAGAMQNIFYSPSPSHQLLLTLWFQDASNSLPPMMTSSTSGESMGNNFFRGMLSWAYSLDRVHIAARSGFLHDFQSYANPVSGEYSEHKSLILSNETSAIFKLGQNHQVEATVGLVQDNINSTNYSERKQRNRFATSVTYRTTLFEKKLNAFAGIKEEFVDGKAIPLTLTAGGRLRLTESIALRGNISRNYRVPTLNELYWFGWGNPSLKPEYGWGEEIGFDHITYTANTRISAKLGAFSNRVNDWIIWMPSGSVWTPENVKKVWARGIEISTSYSRKTTHTHLGTSVSATYTRSTSIDSAAETVTTVGKQLPYVPLVSGIVSLFFEYKSLHIKYTHSFSGKRYTVADHSSSISPNYPASLYIEKRLIRRAFSVDLFLRVTNIWNHEYQVMSYYPMPLRAYHAGLSVLFEPKRR